MSFESIQDLVARTADRHPGQPALDRAGDTLSYRRLRARTLGVRKLLAELEVRPGDRVALLTGDPFLLVPGILGVLETGAAFVPLDPLYPDLRLEVMVSRAAPTVLLCEPRQEERGQGLRPDGCRVLPLRGEEADAEEVPGAPYPADPDARAYVYFTSGSTGLPKGIVGRLRAIDHFIRWEIDTLGLEPGVRVSQLTTPSFDAFLRDVFVPLCCGGTVCVPEERDLVTDGRRLADWIDLEEIEVLHTVPSLIRTLPVRELGSKYFQALRYVLLAGEPLLPGDVARWHDAFGDRVQLVNLYGPSETTMTKFCHFVQPTDRDLRSVPVGEPIRGAEALVLDPKNRSCPPGAVGEICIRTPFRSHGYLDQPELDEEVFIPNPLTDDPDDLIYKTGDFGRLLRDGRLEFLGRRDQQVKVRGVRVELSEIEAVLRAHSGVTDVAVVGRDDSDGNTVLCAYVVGDETAGSGALRALCDGTLPAAMVPSVFLPMESLPRTLSGKIDRRSLPAPADVLGKNQRTHVPPRTDTEKAIAAIWREVLGLSEVGVDSHFFELGGHSLLATRVLSRIRAERGVVVALRMLFADPTVGGLASVVDAELAEGADPEAQAIRRIPRTGEPPVSFAQERLWFLQRLEPESVAYNIAALAFLEGDLRTAAMERSLEEVVERHEPLRTTFPDRDGRPVQRIAESPTIRVRRVDLSALGGGREVAVRAAEREARRPFDLEAGPLLRLTLLRLGPRRHAVLVVVHHMVSDLASMEVFVRDVAALYASLVAGEPSPLGELPIQFADFASWQRGYLRGATLDAELGFWRERLRDGLDPLTLPTDRPRSALRSSRGAYKSFEVPGPLVDELMALAHGEGATLFPVFLSAFQVLLGRYTGESAINVGTPVSGRDRIEVEDLVGFFINTIILRTSLDGSPPFRELLRTVSGEALEAEEHQSLPLELLIEALRPERELSHTPLFQVWFAFQDLSRERIETSGQTLELEPVHHGAAKWDLALFMGRDPDGVRGHFEYDRDLFDPETIDRMIGHLTTLLNAVVETPDARIDQLPLLPPAERRQLLEEWNPRSEAPAEPRRLHEVFESWVERTPTAPAVVCDVEALSYAQLDERANRLARALRAAGVGPEVPVGMLIDRSLDLPVAILGILKAGGGYLPLDPEHPVERTAHALADCGARVVVAQADLRDRLPESVETVIDPSDDALADLSGEPLPAEGAGDLADALAYVIYTSGSTGVPKGTPVSHRHVTRLFGATAERFGFGPDDVWSVFHSPAFDFSVWELWGALLHGGSAVLVPRAVGRSPEAFYRLLAQEGVTFLSQTPSAFRLLVQADQVAPDELRRQLALRWVVFGGEALDVTVLRPWWRRHPEDSPRLVNMYGITETTVHVTWRPLSPADLETPYRSPIGVPIPDLQVHALDREGALVPVGVPGELCVGGAGVARGYVGRPGLTAERFRPDPFGARGARLYHSGDLGRWLASGELEYGGRIDHQVKIRGFRIELGEIESALADAPEIAEAVVLARALEDGDVRLTAYAVPRPGAEIGLGELRRRLAARLPDYMLPSGLVTLEALPMTPNGKIDRRALEGMEPGAAVPAEAGGPPETPLEEVVAAIWSDVLGVDSVGRGEDFFALGGHSLLATRVVSRVQRALDAEVSLLALFENPVLADFVRRLVGEAGAERTPPPLVAAVERPERPPLSFAQERLWFLDRLEPLGVVYNLPMVTRIRGALDPAALAHAFSEVVRRHEVLRTSFPEAEGRGWQRVEPAPAALPLPVVDLGSLPEPARGREAERLARRAGRRPFDLQAGDLVRAQLVRIADDEHLALFVVHHIVFDEWSQGVFLGEVAALYRSRRERVPAALPALPLQYADFATWQREWLAGPAGESLVEHWRSRLAGVPPLDLPWDRPRPAFVSYRGATRALPLPAGLDDALPALGRRLGATPFMILLAGFRALLQRYSGQRDLAVGTPIANRHRLELEPLIGFFVNTLVLRVDLDGDPSFADLVARERAAALEAFVHQDLPFEVVVEAVQPARDLSRSPLFQVMFVLHNTPAPAYELPGTTLTPVGVETGTAKFDLTLFAGISDGRWRASLEYNSDLFDPATVERFGSHFQALLERALEAPERPLAEIDLLTSEERRQLVAWSGPAEPVPEPIPVHRAIEEQARQRPDAVALEWGSERITFGALDRRAEGVARLLASRGVGPEAVVGVALERCPALVATLLGVLKAGGAYLPLDLSYPEERVAHMAAAADLSLVVARPEDRERFEAAGLSVLSLDGEGEPLDGARSEEELSSPVTPDHLAYVLFTSGSTGRPKGVMVPHGPLARYVAWAGEAYRVRAGRTVPLHTTVGFDLSVTGLFVPLAAGQGVALLAEDQAAGNLAEELRRSGDASLVKLTPSHLEVLAHQLGGGTATAARALVVGGEALTFERIAAWRRGGAAPRIVNEYGPTEAVVGCSVYEVAESDPGRGPVPVGRPLPHARLRVVDGRGEDVPPGIAGELCIGGGTLARGYLGQPRETARSFVPDGAATRPGARLYRSGDRARYRRDGNLLYLGRLDRQVKVRGYRIEPEEVEGALLEVPGIRQAAVVVREDASDHGRLVAYAVGEDGAPGAAELRRALERRLPAYMVPAVVVPLDELPLNAHGKLDRSRLPAPEAAGDERGRSSAPYQAPRTPVEETLAAIWSATLGVERVGVHDNFFELGGDSILALQVVHRATEAGVGLSLRQMFQLQTVEELAAAAGTAESAGEGGPLSGPTPLTPIQAWFFERGLPARHHYNQAVTLELLEPVPMSSLRQALVRLHEQHDALRLRYLREEGGWSQVLPAPEDTAPPDALRVDLSGLGPEVASAALEKAADQVHGSFDLATGPLFRVVVADLPEGEPRRLFLVAHHLLVDGVSWEILLADLERLVEADSNGSAAALHPRTTSFKTWAEALVADAPARERELPHWLELEGAEPEGGGPDGPAPWGVEATAERVWSDLPPDETAVLLQETLAKLRCGIDEVLLAALARSFHRVRGVDRLLVDVERHGREELAEELDLTRTVGWFTTLFPVAVEGGAEGDPLATLERVERTLRAVPGKGMGYGLLRHLHPDPRVRGRLERLPRPEVSFNYLGRLGTGVGGSDLWRPAADLGRPRSPLQPRAHRLGIDGGVLEGSLGLAWSYSPELDERGEVEALCEAFVAALREINEARELPGARDYSPGDFPEVELSQDRLDRILAEIEES